MTPTARDLTRHVPRSPFDELGGYPWLARAIDKIRAHQADRIGPYTPFPGGIDQRFLEIIGIPADAFIEVVESGATDQAITDWVDSHCSEGTTERIAAFRLRMRHPAAPEHVDELRQEAATIQAERPELDLSHVVNFIHVICIEEGHDYPTD